MHRPRIWSHNYPSTSPKLNNDSTYADKYMHDARKLIQKKIVGISEAKKEKPSAIIQTALYNRLILLAFSKTPSQNAMP